MIIKVDEYQIRDSEGIKKFDIHVEKTIKKGIAIGRKQVLPLAYGISIERAIEIIIQEKMKVELDTVDLVQFLIEYKETADYVIEKIENIRR